MQELIDIIEVLISDVDVVSRSIDKGTDFFDFVLNGAKKLRSINLIVLRAGGVVESSGEFSSSDLVDFLVAVDVLNLDFNIRAFFVNLVNNFV